MKVFGYTRFSYFGRNDTKISRTIADDEQRFEALYNPKRMEQRFHMFENLCLPSLRAQINKEFKHIIVASDVMPEVYKERLNKSVADVKQIEVLYSSEEHVTYALNPRIKELVKGETANTVHFRLDDDDAICAQTVDMLGAMAKNAPKKMLFTFPRGLFLLANSDGTHLLRKFEPYIAIAFAFVNSPGYVRNPYQCRHGRVFTTFPSQMEPRPYAYIHSAHISSDTLSAQGRKFRQAMASDPDYQSEKAHEEITKILEDRFPGFTHERLIKIMETIPG